LNRKKVNPVGFFFSKGNRKLSQNILIFNMPHGITCRGAGQCKQWCYENKIVRIYKQVQTARIRNYEFSRRQDFVQEIVAFLKNQKETIVRVHESGDFWSQPYLDSWKEISRQLKNKVFFAFTKSFDLDLWSKLPSNFLIIQSYGSKWDTLIDPKKSTALVIDSLRPMKKGEFLCPYHDKAWRKVNKCGEACKYCCSKQPKVKHVVFLKH